MRFYFIFLISLLLLLAACGEKAECTMTSDCPGAAGSNECSSVRCVQGSCVTNIEPDCCGNALCEEGENFCNCESDCATTPCGGPFILKDRYGRDTDSKMVEYGCVKNECELLVPDSKKEEVTITSDSRSGDIMLSATTTLDQPYILGKSSSEVRIQLKDIDESVILPITITQIQLLYGDELVGELLLNEQLASVRDLFTKTIPLTPTLDNIEEELSITIKIDYEYNYLQREEQKIERTSFSDGFKNSLFFIDFSKVEDE